MKRQWLWLSVLFFVALSFLVWHTHQRRSLEELERELEQLRREGEPTSLVDLLHPIPPHQDGTPFYQAAIQSLQAIQAILPKSVWDELNNFASLQPKQPINLADVEKGLRAVQPALEMLWLALTYPHLRLVDWQVENPVELMFSHLSEMRQFARLLSAEALWRKRKGDMDVAIDSCIAILQLARRIGDEPLLVHFGLQGAIFAIGTDTIHQILADADASPQAYRALLRELRAWDINRDFVRGLQMERVMVILLCDWMHE